MNIVNKQHFNLQYNITIQSAIIPGGVELFWDTFRRQQQKPERTRNPKTINFQAPPKKSTPSS